MVQVNLSENRDRHLFDDAAGFFGALGYDISLMEWDFRTYTEMVAAYTPRDLFFPSDAENAISGILNRLSRQTDTPFIYGLPEDDLDRALLWTAVEDEERNVCLLRRRGFPSWSWLGWHGEIEYDCWLINPVLVESHKKDFAYYKHGLATRGLSADPDETPEIIVPENAELRILSSGIMKIESQVAQFRAVMISNEHHLDDSSDESFGDHESAKSSEKMELQGETGKAWRIVNLHGNEVPAGIRYASFSGTYLYVESAISHRLAAVRNQAIELVFLQRWCELPGAKPYRRRSIDDRV